MMSVLFDDVDDAGLQGDAVEEGSESTPGVVPVVMATDARRRLEKWLEERRLREELDDFPDE